jgi:hypothetical protein
MYVVPYREAGRRSPAATPPCCATPGDPSTAPLPASGAPASTSHHREGPTPAPTSCGQPCRDYMLFLEDTRRMDCAAVILFPTSSPPRTVKRAQLLLQPPADNPVEMRCFSRRTHAGWTAPPSCCCPCLLRRGKMQPAMLLLDSSKMQPVTPPISLVLSVAVEKAKVPER